MAFTRLSGGGSENPLGKRYKLTYMWCFETASKTLSLPANTDFIILLNAYYDPNYQMGAGDIPHTGTNACDTPIAIATEVGQTVSTTAMMTGNGTNVAITNPCSLTWTSATQATVTRTNTGSAMQVFAGQYID